VIWWWGLAAALVLFGSVLAAAEASLTRTSRVRALALEEEGRRNAETLVQIESDPPRYLNAVYLTVMFVQNGSAILVAILAEREFGSTWVTLASFLFTLLYFVFVEAMAKTYAVLHTDRVALALAPIVWFLGRLLEVPTRLLIGLANVLLPGKGHERHNHPDAEEILYVLSGEGRQMLDDGEERWFTVKAGDTIYVPQAMYHATINTGWQPIRLLAIYNPGGAERALRDLPDFREGDDGPEWTVAG
jgi:CBS domain containing-hemolysin-like protein